MKIVRIVSLIVFLAGSGVVILPLAFDAALLFIYQQGHEAITRMHLRFVPDEEFNQKLVIAVHEADIDLANQIVEIGAERNVTFQPDLLQKLEEANGTWSTIARNSGQVWHGAKTGEANSGYAFAGVFAKDISGVTDFQELSKELDVYPNHDSLNLGLSVVGVAGTTFAVAGVVTGGASSAVAAPLRLFASAVRVAKRGRKLSKKLERVLSNNLEKIINKKAVGDLAEKFKGIDLTKADKKQIDELAEVASKTVNFKAAGELVDGAKDMKTIVGNGGVAGLSRSLSAADDLADLNRLSKLSKVSKGKYAGHITLAPKLAKSVYKVLNVLFQAIAFLLSAILWLISVIWYFVKVLKFVFFRGAVVAQ